MARNLLGGLVGIILGMLTVSFGERFSHRYYLPPANIDIEDKEALAEMITSMPTSALAIILLAHFLGAFVAAFVASKLAGKNKFFLGLVAGAVILIGTITKLFLIPHPIYISILDVFLTLVGLYLGAKLASPSEVDFDL